MKRRPFLIATLFAVALAGAPAVAQTVQDQIVQQLREQGFDRIRANRTLLGRVRIVAKADGKQREIVFNPSTGAILRDYWVFDRIQDDGDGRVPRVFDPDGNGGRDPDDSNHRDSDSSDRDSDDDDGGDDDGGDDDDDDD